MWHSMPPDDLQPARIRFGEDPYPQKGNPPADVPLQFSLATLLVVTTLVAACLGLTMAVPPLGLPISFVAAGALVRTLIIGKQHQRLGLPFPLGEKFTEFVISCGVVVGAIMVGLLTFMGGCCMFGLAAAGWDQLTTAGVPQDIAGIFGMVLSAAAVLLIVLAPVFTTTWFLWATRPR